MKTTEDTESTEEEPVRDPLTEKVIGCAIEVHKRLGPGLLESVYEQAMVIELRHQKISCERQKFLPAIYRDQNVGEFRIDLIVENQLIIELKAVRAIESIFTAQILTYMKLGNFKKGLIINFNVPKLIAGVKRYVL
ncbi:MAG: GxxExxY protein [Spirochaetes bacterium]|nr:GxxExxY protein [Spirochaetota bacterium]